MRPYRRVLEFARKLRTQAVIALCLAVTSVGLATVGGQAITESAGASAEPTAMFSFYVTHTTGGLMYTGGCNQAGFDNSHGVSAFVVLDFGWTNSSGGMTAVNNNAKTRTTVLIDAENFALGYWKCGGAEHLNVAIGTNSSVPGAVNYNQGVQYGYTVNDFKAWLTDGSFPGLVTAWGGSDIETAVDAWASPAAVTQWYQGYVAVSGIPYVFYGAATGCGANLTMNCKTVVYTTPPQTSRDGWNKGALYNLSWGYALANAVPQIYHGNWATQWYYISLFGQPQAGYMYPIGPMSTPQYTPPSVAWSAMSQYFPYMSFAFEIQWETIL